MQNFNSCYELYPCKNSKHSCAHTRVCMFVMHECVYEHADMQSIKMFSFFKILSTWSNRLVNYGLKLNQAK